MLVWNLNSILSQIDLSTALDRAPAVLPVSFGVMLVLGLILWLMGRKMARPAVALGGLLAGAASATISGQVLAQGHWLLLLAVVGAISGCLLSLLLFRFWMGVSCALILALAAPLALLAWTGVAPPDDQRLDLSQPRQGERVSFVERAKTLYESERAQAERWWHDLGDSKRRWVMIVAGGAAVLGLLAGLIAPRTASAMQSALIGSSLLLAGGVGLLRLYGGDLAQKIPTSPRAVVLAAGLITLCGVLVQWTLWRRKTDNG